MANPNIFMQYMQPLKSVADYSADMDAADAVRSRNALAALTMQATTDKLRREQSEYERGQGVRNKLSALVQQFGGDEEKLIGAARVDPDLYSWAQEQETARLERRGKVATASKAEAEAKAKADETQRARRSQQIQQMAAAQTPEQAVEMLNTMDAIPMAERTQLVKMMSAVSDPQKFMQIKGLIVLGLAQPEQQVQGMMPKYTSAGGQLAQTNPLSPEKPIAVTMSPSERDASARGWASQNLARERFALERQQAERPEWDSQTNSFIDRTNQRVIPAPGGAPGKPLNDVQSKALLFGSRALESHKVLEQMAQAGVTQPGKIKRVAETAGQIVGLGTSFGDVLGSAAGTMTNWTQSPDQQSVEQAQRDFINAILRRESGAVISDSEFDNARKQYFPQPGDSDQVKAQKKKNRETAIRGLMAEVPEGRRELPQIPALQPKPAATASPVDTSAGVPPDISDILKKYTPPRR